MSPEPSKDESLERIKIAGELRLRQAELDFEREKWLEERGRTKRFQASPLVLSATAAILGLLGTAVGAYLQGSSNSALERQKFESALIGKAFESADPEQAAKYLTYLAQTGLVRDQDLNSRLMKLASSPESIPVLARERGVAELASREPGTPRRVTMLVLSDMQTLNTLGTIRLMQDTSFTTASYHYMLDTSGVAIPVVPEHRIAYHTAGRNEHTISIGIAHVSKQKAKELRRAYVPYTSAQIKMLHRLVIDIARRHGIEADSIVAKSQLDPSKYSDVAELLGGLRQGIKPPIAAGSSEPE